MSGDLLLCVDATPTPDGHPDLGLELGRIYTFDGVCPKLHRNNRSGEVCIYVAEILKRREPRKGGGYWCYCFNSKRFRPAKLSSIDSLIEIAKNPEKELEAT
jgi:hypothetical protein